MSRGLGKIERAVSDALAKEELSMHTVVSLYHEIHGPPMDVLRAGGSPWARYNALTRALRSLKRKGLADWVPFPVGRVWMTPETKRELVEMSAELDKAIPKMMQALERMSEARSDSCVD